MDFKRKVKDKINLYTIHILLSVIQKLPKFALYIAKNIDSFILVIVKKHNKYKICDKLLCFNSYIM